MPQIRIRIAVALVSTAFLAGLPDGAFAQSQDAARQKCIAQAQQEYPGTDTEQMRNRTYAYAACMEKAGLRL